MNKMSALMGGRAAEQLVFGKLSTGAADDIGQATNIARTMVMHYGMDESLGQVSYMDEQSSFLGQELPYAQHARQYSEQTAAQIDDAVRALIDAAIDRARSILVSHRLQLDETAELLLERETLSGDELPQMEIVSEPSWESA
jgi:cell division protease FtsH